MVLIHRFTSMLKPLKLELSFPSSMAAAIRRKTTSYQYVESRARDPTFEKLMDKYKNLLKVISIQDLILANPNSQSISLDFLSRLAQKLHLNRGAASFLSKFPHVFNVFYDPSTSQPRCRLTDAAACICREEALAIESSIDTVVDRVFRLLSMSPSNSLPLRAVFKVWRELGLPDDFEDSVISKNSNLFQLSNDLREKNTHILKLVKNVVFKDHILSTAIDSWRISECCKDDSDSNVTSGVDRTEIRFAFKHKFPPGMKLGKNFKAKVKEWQKLPYTGPYEEVDEMKKKNNKMASASEKRAVAIVHEFLSLTVEKMIEVEKISHFRKWYGIDLNIRDLFLDHPGIFYLSTKGKRHTVFLREAYERGCLIDPNPVYDVRRKLLDLVVLGRHGLDTLDSISSDMGKHNDIDLQEDDSDCSISPSD